MNKDVAALAPSALWTNFELLNEVPRPSKKEERVIAFMKNFGESLGLETIVEPIGNVIVKKPATAGMENRKTVVLQSHIDMVHQKNSDTDFDFDTEGIRSYIDDGWVKAEGTTLGADNGMGVAAIMAVLQATDIPHGPLEALFTIDEETGMTGAEHLLPTSLQGEILLNLDTEDEGELCIGCAGGIDTNINFAYDEVAPTASAAYKISIRGLKGGHSGCDIHLGRGNANKIMNRLLWKCNANFGLQVARIDGGSLRNAIPRESSATVVVDTAKKSAFEKHIAELTAIIAAELKRTEPDLEVSLSAVDTPAKVMETGKQEAFLAAMYASPNGVIRMSDDVPGLVETSTSLARVLVENGKTLVQFLNRSSVETAKDDLTQIIESCFGLMGANVEHAGGYPGWTPNADSEVLHSMKKLYKKLYDKEVIVNAVHAGLECGIILKQYPNMDAISFGPTIKNPHSPDEMCKIDTVKMFWDYFLATLADVAENN